ncbi:CAP domain-containing protein [Candidatus Methanoperedens nitratireducens]|uniref:SCP domain-containing protein n=1 Tax=Candidatus Methanoperedens nitratireducens TaxID=1392998 RepID=A0A284VUI6_9EURY|nr:CAP domain-containing protein [Candidatus Methanoperedens nitroreducens]SNQ62879.1 conserved hypothetical protein [Candidatus Methanoperedens nitroreducens]
MSGKTALFVILLVSLTIFTAGCTSYVGDSSYSMRFSINETGEPLEGNVLNNGILLGYAQNGSFTTNLEKLRPGLIALNGTYESNPFEFYFEFPSESFNYSGIDFTVREKDLRKVLFNTSVLNIPQLEREVFDQVNKERAKSGLKSLKWNDRIASVSKNYSKTLSIQGFHHKDIEGKDAGDRLKESKIFYTVASENLYMIEGLNETVNISETAVNGWLGSPAHRSPIMDRDGLFSDSGVGIYCEEKTCYAVMVFAGLERNENIKLEPGYLTFLYLNDPSYPFDFDVAADVEIDSTANINIYIVSGSEQYDNLMNNRDFQSVIEDKMISRFSRKITAAKGYGIVVQTLGDSSAQINIHIRYS